MSIKSELRRKALHLTGLAVPAVYLLLGRDFTLLMIGLFFGLFVVLEPFRIIEEWRDRIKYHLLKIYPSPELGKSIERIENHIEAIKRPHERGRVAAHIYFAAASFIVVYFFPENVAIGAISVATLGDAMAAIIGKSFGKHRFKNGKSVEGSLAYFVTAFMVLLLVVDPLTAFIGSVIGTIVEFYNIPPDDNFSNQVATALALYLAGFLTG